MIKITIMFFLTFFPGFTIYILQNIFEKAGYYRIKIFDLYSMILFSYIVINYIFLIDKKTIYYFIFLIIIVIMLLFQTILYFRVKNIYTLIISTKFKLIVLIPILEEIIFRNLFFYYADVMDVFSSTLGIMFYNVLIFMLLHYYRDGFKVIKKIIISCMLIVAYYIGGLYLSILLHVIYNMIVYELTKETIIKK